jgi:hypothetical protein
MSPAMREFFGQGHSGAFAFAESIAAQQSQLRFRRALKEFDRPIWSTWSPTLEQLDAGWRPLDPAPLKYGVLAGKHVSPDVYDTVVNMPKLYEQGGGMLISAVRRISSWSKAMEVPFGGLHSYMNSLLGNPQSVIMSGVPPHELLNFGASFARAAKGLYDRYHGPMKGLLEEAHLAPEPLTEEGAYRAEIYAARRLGVDAPGWAATELTASANNALMRSMLKAAMETKSANVWGAMTDVFRVAHQSSLDLKARVGVAFDLTDRINRIASWQTLWRMNVKDGMGQEEAMRAAARDVLASFPMPDRVGPLVHQVRSIAGWLSPYVTYSAEYLRIYGNLPGRILTNPRISNNLIAYGMLVAGILSTLQAHHPVEAKLIEEADNNLPKSTKQFRPCRMWAPFTDSDGKPVLMDLAPMFEVCRYIGGPEDMGMPERIFGNAILQFSSRGAAGEWAKQGLSAMDPRWQQWERDRRKWETGMGSFIDWAWQDFGVAPKFIPRAYDDIRSTGALGELPMTQQPQTPFLAGGRTIGLPFIRRPSPLAVPMEMRGEMNSLGKDVRDRAKLPDSYPGGMIGGRPGLDAKLQDINTLIENFNKGTKK